MRPEFQALLDDTTRIGVCHFRIPKAVQDVMDAIKAQPVFAGERVACERRVFKPSAHSLEALRATMPIVEVNDKSAWLVVCGKDVLVQGVVKDPGVPDGVLVLIADTHGQTLGYGVVQRDKDGRLKLVKRLYDIGDYLRRE